VVILDGTWRGEVPRIGGLSEDCSTRFILVIFFGNLEVEWELLDDKYHLLPIATIELGEAIPVEVN